MYVSLDYTYLIIKIQFNHHQTTVFQIQFVCFSVNLLLTKIRNMNKESNYSETLKDKFGWEEYTVFSIVLVLSTGIGLFYGVYKRKEQSKDEYLMGKLQYLIPMIKIHVIHIGYI